MGQGEEAGRAPSQASQAGMSVSGRLVKAKTAVLTAEEAVTREGTGRRERGIPRSSPQLASPQTPSPTKTLRMNGPVRTRGPHHCVIGRLAEAGLRFQTRLTSPSKDPAPRLVSPGGAASGEGPPQAWPCLHEWSRGMPAPPHLESLPSGYLRRAQNDSGTSQGCGKVPAGGEGLPPL